MFLDTISKYNVLNEEVVDYEDLSNSFIRGVNRMVNDKKGVASVTINNNEVDTAREQDILPYINDFLYITSDLHLNHKNRNSSNLYNLVLNDINSKINLDGAIMFLGDMGKKDDPAQGKYIRSFVERINCKTKILILGNHDILPIKDYYQMGFSYVSNILMTDKYVFTHCPYDVEHTNKINFHGHIHFSKEYWNMDWRKHIDVYIGAHDYKVLQLKDYLELYKKGYYNGKTVQKDLTKK
jgi:calcineurin-like phosphoesterase family protein